MNMTEKRKAERFELDLLVNVILSQNVNKRDIISAHTINVSSEGAYLDTKAPLKEGTDVKLELFLSMDKAVDSSWRESQSQSESRRAGNPE